MPRCIKSNIRTKINENNCTTTDITYIISELLKIIRNKQDSATDLNVSKVNEATEAAVATEAAKVGGKRKPSKYNIFMKKN